MLLLGTTRVDPQYGIFGLLFVLTSGSVGTKPKCVVWRTWNTVIPTVLAVCGYKKLSGSVKSYSDHSIVVLFESETSCSQSRW